MTTFPVQDARTSPSAAGPRSTRGSGSPGSASTPTRARGARARLRAAGKALAAGPARAGARIGARIDERILAEHVPTVDDSSAWCTRHWGGLQEWPCRDYVEASAARARRPPR